MPNKIYFEGAIDVPQSAPKLSTQKTQETTKHHQAPKHTILINETKPNR